MSGTNGEYYNDIIYKDKGKGQPRTGHEGLEE